MEFIDIEKKNKITSLEHNVYFVCCKCFQINIKSMIHPANKLQTVVINGVRVNKCFFICFVSKMFK